jgi:hypothetical protein
VQNTSNMPAQSAPFEAPVETSPSEGPAEPWQFAVNLLLTQAAALCVQNGVDLDAFMNGAWSAYLEARPGMRDQLEEAHLRNQLDELRQLGRLGSA